MKKILLFITGLMLAVCASAQVYLRGNGDASYSVNEEFLFTDNGDGTHTLTKSFELKSDFKIATSDWSVFNFGSAGEEAKVGTIRVLNGTDNNVSVSSLINVTSMTLDTNANTLTIVGENAGEITYSSWTICGVGELLGDAWSPASTINVMTESDGVYTLIKKNVSLSSDFITDADNPEKATLGYGYKVVADAQWGIKEYPADGTNQFVKISKDGIYDIIFTFNPSTKELSASATLISESGNNNTDDEEHPESGAVNVLYYSYDSRNMTATVDYCANCTGSIVIPASITIETGYDEFEYETYSVTRIGTNAFSGRSGLTSITIPNSVTSIGDYAFSRCSGLTSIIIPSSVTFIAVGAFSGCSGLTSIIIPSSVTEISGSAFEDCSGLTSVTIPNSVTSIGVSAFFGCSGLTSITIPNGVTEISHSAFEDCSGLTSVTIPNSVTRIGTDAFYGCSSLTSVTIGDNVSDISCTAFLRCINLTNFNISLGNKSYSYENGVLFNKDKTKLVSFLHSNTETNYIIPNSVTSIGYGAFYLCSSLTSLTIPANINEIGEEAFYGCNNLKRITINSKTVPITNYEWVDYLFGTYIAYLYVPCEALENYELDNVFGRFKYIRCIEEEEETPEDVEIEVDDNGNVNIKWPPTEGANSYKLLVSQGGEVFCTLLFNSMGQLTSIDLSKRSASVGFQFTVTGLTEGSKYGYEMTALSEDNEVLDYYAGAFITNGYKEDDDVTTSVNETVNSANITVSGGTISADADFTIYNTVGKDVTALNGSLQPGVYIISIGEDIVKVMVR